ncbi:PREDICTED: protein FAM170A-like, partial [Miniopterus natalensis]|uniref:protein FAM170A-like n=1 Tax=Miniopterus natalensis TaxID=291302 RepID=UPI0007A6C89C
PCITDKDAPKPESPGEAATGCHPAGENSSSSEYFSCVSSPSKFPRLDEDGTYGLRQNISCLETLEKPVPKSSRKQKNIQGHIGGPCNTQEDAPKPESPVELPGCSHPAGENSSSSEYFTCVSSPSKFPRLDEDGIKMMPVSQELKQKENPFTFPHKSSHLVKNNEPFMSSVCGTNLRLMTIYYMRVRMKRGVAVLSDSEEGLEPPSKQMKMEEMTYVEKVHKNVPHSHMSPTDLLIDEPSSVSQGQSSSPKFYRLVGRPSQEVYPKATVPEWLVAPDRGFRCMACCRVFPSLDVLQEHVEYGVNEGFSCHAFHLAMARLKHKEPDEENEEENPEGRT